MWEIRKKAVNGLKAGDVFMVKRTFTQNDVVAFAEMTKDYNPVHFSKAFAETKRFTGRICHGLLTASLITEIGGEIGWLASSMSFQFKKPVYFNDTVTCRMTIESVDEKGRATAHADFVNQHGEKVLTAELKGVLPGEAEKRIMKDLTADSGPAEIP